MRKLTDRILFYAMLFMVVLLAARIVVFPGRVPGESKVINFITEGR